MESDVEADVDVDGEDHWEDDDDESDEVVDDSDCVPVEDPEDTVTGSAYVHPWPGAVWCCLLRTSKLRSVGRCW